LDSSIKYFTRVNIFLSHSMISLTFPHSSQDFSAGEGTVSGRLMKCWC
jgi:hypothetical protein